MNDLEQKADELVEKFVQKLIDNSNWDAITSDGVICAIQSINHTISALEELSLISGLMPLELAEKLDEQLELKKILEGRL